MSKIDSFLYVHITVLVQKYCQTLLFFSLPTSFSDVFDIKMEEKHQKAKESGDRELIELKER